MVINTIIEDSKELNGKLNVSFTEEKSKLVTGSPCRLITCAMTGQLSKVNFLDTFVSLFPHEETTVSNVIDT
ncbi:hypothetical protein AAH060_21865 [Parabacteroides distasonis]|uniref:hypothetical protein n=1 Tax=Parabacteroides distasonis TaxID=823 RepID=UPI0039B3FB54